MIAVLVFIITHGRSPRRRSSHRGQRWNDAPPTGVQQVEETIKQTQLAQSGLGIGGVMMAASSVLIVLAALLMVLLGGAIGAST